MEVSLKNALLKSDEDLKAIIRALLFKNLRVIISKLVLNHTKVWLRSEDDALAKVIAVNISEKKGTFKYPIEHACLKIEHGIVWGCSCWQLEPAGESAGSGKHG
jgi:hypothetical protein